MAIKQDINQSPDYFTGEDKDLVFTIYTSDARTARTAAQDITGWTLSWMVKANRFDPDSAALIEKTTSDDIALTTPASGVCTVTVRDTDVNTLTGEVRYYHELKRTTSGAETVLAYGKFTLSQAVHE